MLSSLLLKQTTQRQLKRRKTTLSSLLLRYPPTSCLTRLPFNGRRRRRLCPIANAEALAPSPSTRVSLRVLSLPARLISTALRPLKLTIQVDKNRERNKSCCQIGRAPNSKRLFERSWCRS